MAYKIQYGSTLSEQPINNRSLTLRILLSAVVFSLFMIYTWQYWPEGKAVLETILPSPSTRAAAEAFAEDLRDGISISDAAETFCKEILSHGNFP